MRQKRAKAYRKLMNLYSISFGFRQPYQVLVDSEICISAVAQKLDLHNQLCSVLQGEVKPSGSSISLAGGKKNLEFLKWKSRSSVITQCCIHELYLQGKEQQPAVDLAKTFERRKCNHREAIPGDECLTSMIGTNNKHRYVVATQSHPLRIKLRSIPAAPIIHINRSVMVLEPPSDTTLNAKRANEERTLHATLPELKSEGASTSTQPVRKRKRPKGPNPLSVKKKKSKEHPQPSHRRESKELACQDTSSTGSKRKLERLVDHDVEPSLDGVLKHDGDNSTDNKRKRRKSDE